MPPKISRARVQACKHIFAKQPAERSAEDVLALVALVEEVKFFKDKERALQMELSRCMTYRRLKQGEYVFHQGDVGTTFYVLLNGAVDVNITKRTTTFTAVTLHAGDSFGDLALINDAPRAAAIYCALDCEFLVIEKDDYQRILAALAAREFEERAEFLSTMPIFKTSAPDALQSMVSILAVRKEPPNTVIIKQNDDPDNFYIVYKGLCRIVMQVDLPREYVRDQEEEQYLARTIVSHRDLPGSKETTRPSSAVSRPGSAVSRPGSAVSRPGSAVSRPGSAVPSRRAYVGRDEASPSARARGARPQSAAPAREKRPSSVRHMVNALTGEKAQRRPQSAKPETTSVRRMSSAPAVQASARERSAVRSAGPSRPQSASGAVSMTAVADRMAVLRKVQAKKAERPWRRPESAMRARVTTDTSRLGDEVEPKLLDIGTLGPRQYFGEVGLLLNIPRLASIVSVTEVTLLCLPKNDFVRRIEGPTLDMLRENISYYPDMTAVKKAYHEQLEWDKYKHRIVKDVIQDKRVRTGKAFDMRGGPLHIK